ncbi:MAG: mechanosensitive ion channel family protein, partial [Gammaproteobacteria bacterium]|nr:mechanosensitive ion channel family protein [Gammaproteobacteria bacterium]
ILVRGGLAETHMSFFRKLLVWIFILIGFSIALTVVGLGGAAKGLLTGGGITAVVLGFAFREIVENFLAGFFLAFSSPFKVGDLIQSEGLEGTVKNVELRSTHIRTADGRDIFIPSNQIYKNPLINYTMDGLRRYSFTVGLAYTDDADGACELLRDTVKQSGLTLTDPEPFVGISNFLPGYVELTTNFWIDTFNPPTGVASPRSALMALCRRALVNKGFSLRHDLRFADDKQSN